MFASDIVESLNQMVHDILWARSLENSEKKVMLVTLALKVAKDQETFKDERRHLHFMFHSPNNYVLVGSQVSDHFSNIPDLSTWKYRSYHDSCWRYDGTNSTLFNEYVDMCKAAFPDIAPAKLDATARIQSIKFLEVRAVKFDRGESIQLEF